jgi:hypothetical protein
MLHSLRILGEYECLLYSSFDILDMIGCSPRVWVMHATIPLSPLAKKEYLNETIMQPENVVIVWQHRGTWSTMHCRLYLNCYGTS